MARISLDPPRSPSMKLGEWYSRRRFGDVLDPARAMGHNRRVFRTYVKAEMSAQKWSALPAPVGTLAVMASAAAIGCEWCMDFGYWIGMNEGIDPQKVRSVPRWRESDVYAPVERAAMEYAEAMSTTPLTVTDEHVARLREFLDEAQLVELTATVALENQRARFNTALGLPSQGFSDRCELRPVP
ncbi:Alkylhydroperoxidase family enzyme, contains CxxC motif [Jatrophihabitans endophyticus]|uniref:Alkylhydroperoxidase family enzyme, contains CxxC motif n=1 Tax=Jatrophihabitans endophyticus TaxID=1206085 RepID=A0A1M5IC68_9ACTN|nr:carboxymuconolactone decarboxylase family protein [Jatrophihabitans endophyticus]SHG25659.1 Alkylhydroperoxidase family enzyme, contains CxxC motif [Jatrophihabitans endophyticus]